MENPQQEAPNRGCGYSGNHTPESPPKPTQNVMKVANRVSPLLERLSNRVPDYPVRPRNVPTVKALRPSRMLGLGRNIQAIGLTLRRTLPALTPVGDSRLERRNLKTLRACF